MLPFLVATDFAVFVRTVRQKKFRWRDQINDQRVGTEFYNLLPSACPMLIYIYIYISITLIITVPSIYNFQKGGWHVSVTLMAAVSSSVYNFQEVGACSFPSLQSCPRNTMGEKQRWYLTTTTALPATLRVVRKSVNYLLASNTCEHAPCLQKGQTPSKMSPQVEPLAI